MRTKSFDPDEALKDALTTFWQQGFEATNLPELLEATGVGRASFYNAFGSKRGVFLRSLDLYFETVRAHLESLLADAGGPRQAVARLVDGILDVARGAGATGWRGCLIGNTALELGASDPEVVTRLKVGVEILRTLFKKAISLPSAAGAKRSEREINLAALQLVANVQGLLVLAKSGLSDADIKDMRAVMLACVFNEECEHSSTTGE
jgi:TetR/AcrR family transcriptional regulator, transcriptional repressor for nem operon